MVIPVDGDAEVVGRAVAAVLAQTFAHHEVVVVDHGVDPRTATAVRSVADRRVRLIQDASVDQTAAVHLGIDAARGRWISVLQAHDEVAPGWLARLGRLIDATDAEFVSCGGEQHHRDGSLTRILPSGLDLPHGRVHACLRPGSFAVTRQSLRAANERVAGDGHPAPIDELCLDLLYEATKAGSSIVHSPEPLVRWNDVADRLADHTAGLDGNCAAADDAVDDAANERSHGAGARAEHSPRVVRQRAGAALAGAAPDERLRLRCSLQGLDALARTPIPDGALLTRYAVTGGVAAARLDEWSEARRLFRLARRLEPAVWRHWARWTLSLVPPVADRVWQPASRAA